VLTDAQLARGFLVQLLLLQVCCLVPGKQMTMTYQQQAILHVPGQQTLISAGLGDVRLLEQFKAGKRRLDHLGLVSLQANFTRESGCYQGNSYRAGSLRVRGPRAQ
jgi:hypothetical protein